MPNNQRTLNVPRTIVENFFLKPLQEQDFLFIFAYNLKNKDMKTRHISIAELNQAEPDATKESIISFLNDYEENLWETVKGIQEAKAYYDENHTINPKLCEISQADVDLAVSRWCAIQGIANKYCPERIKKAEQWAAQMKSSNQ